MKLDPIAPNMTEIDINTKRILFSYKTPVAYFDRLTNTYHKTSSRWSNTTQRHINKWVNHLSEPVNWIIDLQETLDNLI